MPLRLSRRAVIEASAPAILLAHGACRSASPESSRPRNERALTLEMSGIFSMDGAGVRLRRSIGSSALSLLDPFLLLDEIHSDIPD